MRYWIVDQNDGWGRRELSVLGEKKSTVQKLPAVRC